MALTIKMRIDEQPEHSYVFSTGDGGQIELIPLSVVQNGSYKPEDGKAYNLVTVNVPETELEHLNITANGTYTAEDGKAYDVVTVNVQPILEAVTRSYTENGTYTIEPSEGNDGISGVTVNVNVPTGGGGGDVLTGTVTVADGENALPITIPSGKTVKQATMYLTNFSDIDNITLRDAMCFASFTVTGDGLYRVYGIRSDDLTPFIDVKDVTHDTGTTPEIDPLNPIGIDETTGEVKYRGKNVDDGYSFIAGYSYTYIVVLE